jgi:hypothetical protein
MTARRTGGNNIMGNPNHGPDGKFSQGSSSGAATGDHQKVSPSPAVRNVEGRTVPRSKPLTRHNGAASVGTDMPKPRFIGTPNGLRPKQMSIGLSNAAQERKALNQRADESHYPTRTVRDIAGKLDLGKPAKPRAGWPYNN